MSENNPNIHVHIERLILDGLPVESRQGPHVQAALEVELARLLTANGLAEQFQSGGDVPSARAPGMQLTDSSSSRIGQQIAQSIYGGIGNIR